MKIEGNMEEENKKQLLLWEELEDVAVALEDLDKNLCRLTDTECEACQ